MCHWRESDAAPTQTWPLFLTQHVVFSAFARLLEQAIVPRRPALPCARQVRMPCDPHAAGLLRPAYSRQPVDIEGLVMGWCGVAGRGRGQGLTTMITLIFAGQQTRCRRTVSRHRSRPHTRHVGRDHITGQRGRLGMLCLPDRDRNADHHLLIQRRVPARDEFRREALACLRSFQSTSAWPLLIGAALSVGCSVCVDEAGARSFDPRSTD
jgi:hypothetical protein